MNIIEENKKMYLENLVNFKIIFGKPLLRYFNPITGFNISKFDDEMIQSKDGESMKEKTLFLYKENGVRIIEKLIS